VVSPRSAHSGIVGNAGKAVCAVRPFFASVVCAHRKVRRPMGEYLPKDADPVTLTICP